MSETPEVTSEVTVGIDIGTTSVKAVAADATGRILARTRVPHRLNTNPVDTFEHDANVAWRDDVIDALAQVSDGLDIVAVAVSAMVPSATAVDANGRAMAPGLLYGDRRGQHGPPLEPELAALPGDGREVLGFVSWLAEKVPGAVGYWPAQAVANHALTGEGFIDPFTATTSFPLFDLRGWDPARAGSCSVDVGQLPRVIPDGEPGGRVQDGLPAAGALVAGGTVDGYGEQIVSGADAAGDVLVICGSTLITWCISDSWLQAPGLWSVPHRRHGWCQIGGPSNAGGIFQDRVARLVGTADPDDVLDPGDVPVWLPYVRGERTPLHRRDLRAALHDVGLHHGPADVVRAAREAAAFVVRHHVELASRAGFMARRIIATGGGTRSAGLMQALADGTGLPVDVAAHPEGAALGAAYVARRAAGLEADVDRVGSWSSIGGRVVPEASWQSACDDRYGRFRVLTAEALESSTSR